jgi:anthranilate phosphoribosyltransferase
MAGVIAEVLARRGVEGFVFHGDDGLDELTTTTTSTVWVVAEGAVREERLDPTELGISPAAPQSLVGGDVAFNVATVHRLLAGEPGPVRDAVALNAAAGIAAFEGSRGTLVQRLGQGVELATAALDSGAAAETLARWLAAVEAA